MKKSALLCRARGYDIFTQPSGRFVRGDHGEVYKIRPRSLLYEPSVRSLEKRGISPAKPAQLKRFAVVLASQQKHPTETAAEHLRNLLAIARGLIDALDSGPGNLATVEDLGAIVRRAASALRAITEEDDRRAVVDHDRAAYLETALRSLQLAHPFLPAGGERTLVLDAVSSIRTAREGPPFFRFEFEAAEPLAGTRWKVTDLGRAAIGAAIVAPNAAAIDALGAPVERQPTAYELAGMAWWNALGIHSRALWLSRSTDKTVAGAWAAFNLAREGFAGGSR